jgi:hypothetical protein
MWPAHFCECVAYGDHVMGSDVQSCQFCFRHRGHYKFDDLCNRQDGAVGTCYGFILQEEDVGSCSAAGARFSEELASECDDRIILLAWFVVPSLGWVAT